MGRGKRKKVNGLQEEIVTWKPRERMFPRRGGQQDLVPEMLRKKRSLTDCEGPYVFSGNMEEAACSGGETFNIEFGMDRGQ